MTVPLVQIGEGFAGDGVDAAHVNTVLGPRDGPIGGAWANALASPSAGHAPFVVVAEPNLPVQPMTLFVNKATIANDRHGELTWGAAQAGVAAGVLAALHKDVILHADVHTLVLIAAVWVNPDAERRGGGVRQQRSRDACRARRRPRRVPVGRRSPSGQPAPQPVLRAMTPEQAAHDTAAIVVRTPAGFMTDPATFARGAALGFEGMDFYVAGRGGALGDVPADVVDRGVLGLRRRRDQGGVGTQLRPCCRGTMRHPNG